MRLALVVERYLSFKRSLGMGFETAGAHLHSFSRAMGDIDIRRVQPDRVAVFLLSKGRVTSAWHYKHIILNGFYRFAVSRGHVTQCPLPTMIPKKPEAMLPYIYTTKELQALLDETPCLSGPRSPDCGRVFRVLLLTLYGAGLRIGEALKLTLTDVDLDKGLLLVRDGKFHKTRLVPIGPRLIATLKAHIEKGKGRGPAIFPSSLGTAMGTGCAEQLFSRLRREAGVRREPQARYQPRLHDIRHTAAVHRLLAWYRRGKDVQHLLPKLSVYLGHAHISGTQRYLTMTPDLLKQANRRFERYALSEVRHD